MIDDSHFFLLETESKTGFVQRQRQKCYKKYFVKVCDC